MELEDIYISAVSFRLPLASTTDELMEHFYSTDFSKIKQTQEKFSISNNSDRNSTVSKFDLNSKTKDIPYMPKRSDAKIMRPDVIASTICAQELMKGINLSLEEKKKIPFYMANGFCLDRLSDKINEMSSKYLIPEEAETASKNDFNLFRNQALDRFTPPLFVLNALTNAAQSFCSQYGEFKGDNATMGSTSQSAFYSLEQACLDLKNGSSQMAVVGCSNGAGVYSAASQQSRVEGNLYESEASSFILLETKQSLKNRGAKAIAKISLIKDSKKIPSLLEANTENNSIFLQKNSNVAHGIFSGSITNQSHDHMKKSVQATWEQSYSLFPLWGSLGVAQNCIDIILGTELIKKNNLKSIDCYNEDLYGRGSLVRIEVSDV